MKRYCVYIDFEKVLDSVWHIGLWSKVFLDNIDGESFEILHVANMFKGVNQWYIVNRKCFKTI